MSVEQSEQQGNDFVAYPLPGRAEMPLVPAQPRTEWMDRTRFSNANHCLPLLMANQSGWWLLNTHDFRVSWDGGDDASSLHIAYRAEDARPYPASSHFGYGLLTFPVPYLFRTPPGWNLLCRGPANRPKDCVAALEGLIETDWSSSSFTMNWQLTRPDAPIYFRRGEPICLLVPQRRGDLESMAPRLDSIEGSATGEAYRAWSAGRLKFKHDKDPDRPDWQHHYLTGRRTDGSPVADHQRRLRLGTFGDQNSPPA